MIVSDELKDAEESVHGLFQYILEMPRDGEENRCKVTQDNRALATDSMQDLQDTNPEF
jgi:hypothetical protein